MNATTVPTQRTSTWLWLTCALGPAITVAVILAGSHDGTGPLSWPTAAWLAAACLAWAPTPISVSTSLLETGIYTGMRAWTNPDRAGLCAVTFAGFICAVALAWPTLFTWPPVW